MICPICKNEYDNGGNAWKKICYDCYKNYRMWKRIQPFGWKENIYITHPSVTKKELDDWIKDKGKERGWGVQEVNPEFWTKWKVWTDSVNYD